MRYASTALAPAHINDEASAPARCCSAVSELIIAAAERNKRCEGHPLGCCVVEHTARHGRVLKVANLVRRVQHHRYLVRVMIDSTLRRSAAVSMARTTEHEHTLYGMYVHSPGFARRLLNRPAQTAPAIAPCLRARDCVSHQQQQAQGQQKEAQHRQRG